MKYLFIICSVMLLGLSCKKEEEKINSLAEDLKQVINEQKIDALQYCCQSCTCSQTIGWGTDFSFPGDNFVRIKDQTYNLNVLLYYEVKTFSSGSGSEKRMVLYFPNP